MIIILGTIIIFQLVAGSIEFFRNVLNAIAIFRVSKYTDETTFYLIQNLAINDIETLIFIDTPSKNFKKLILERLIQPDVTKKYSKRFSEQITFHSKNLINFILLEQHGYTRRRKRASYQHIARIFGKRQESFLECLTTGKKENVYTFLKDFLGDNIWRQEAVVQATKCFSHYSILLDYIDPQFQPLFAKINGSKDKYIDQIISKYINLVEGAEVHSFLYKLNYSFNGGILLCIFYLFNYLQQLSKLFALSEVIFNRLQDAHKRFLQKSYDFAYSVYDKIEHVAEVNIDKILCDDIYLLPSTTLPSQLTQYKKCIKIKKISYHKAPLDKQLLERFKVSGYPIADSESEFFLDFFNFEDPSGEEKGELKVYSTNENAGMSHFHDFIRQTVNSPFTLTEDEAIL